MGYDFDIQQQLAKMRGAAPEPAPRGRSPQPPKNFETRPKAATQAPQAKPAQGNAGASTTKPATPAASSTEAPRAKPAAPEKETAATPETGFVVAQSHSERPGASDPPKRPTVDYQRFKPLPGLFERVANNFDRPIGLVPTVKKVNISGQLDPLLEQVRRNLSERVLGQRVSFPWGEFTIDRKNRVLATNAGLMRYLSFDALRDADGTHVQYALQMFALSNPGGFDKQFDPSMMRSGDDTLDVYALMLVVYQLEQGGVEAREAEHIPPSLDEQFQDLSRMMNGIASAMSMQQEQQAARLRRTQATETILLMDRLGLLKGQLPKDLGSFVRLLEVNRAALAEVTHAVDAFVDGEEKREATLRQQARKQNFRKS